MATRFILSCLIAQSIILIQLIPCNEAAKHEHQTQCPTNTKLIKLPDGTFDCLFCSTCPPGKVERIPCDHDKDTVCSICKRGFIYDKTNKTCTQCTVCEPELCNDTECTDNTDTVCKMCPTKTTPSPHTIKEITNGSTYNGGTTEANEKGINASIEILVSAAVIPPIVVVICIASWFYLRKRASSSAKNEPNPSQIPDVLNDENESDRYVSNPVGYYDMHSSANSATHALLVPSKAKQGSNAPLPDIHQTGKSSLDAVKANDILRNEISDSCQPKLKSSNQTKEQEQKSPLLKDKQYESPSVIRLIQDATKPETDEYHKNLGEKIKIDETEKGDRIKDKFREKDILVKLESSENNRNNIERNADQGKVNKREFRDADTALIYYKKSVGSLFYKGRMVTLFRVGSVYVMTSYTAVKELLDDLKNRDATERITFGSQLDSKKHHSLSRQPVMIEPSLDIVILELQTDPQALPDGLPLSSEKFSADELKLTFIANGKYATDKLQIIKNNSVIPFESKPLKTASEHIRDAGYQTNGKNLYQGSIDELGNPSRCIWKCPITPLQSYGSPGLVQQGNSYTVVCMYSHMIPPDIVGTAIVKDIYRFYTGPTMAELYKTLKSRDSKLTDELFSV